MGFYHHCSPVKRIILERQFNRCAICNDDNPKQFDLDHDHRKGGFRGVLCHRCNLGLVNFCDSPELLRRAAEYLEIPRIARFPRKLSQSQAGKLNVKFATRAAAARSRTKKQLESILKAQKLRWKQTNS